MALGYEVAEDTRSFETQGLTGKVTRFSTTALEFPAFVIMLDDKHPLKAITVDAFKRMEPRIDDVTEDISLIHVYAFQGEQLAKLGMISATQVQIFLNLFKDNEVVGYVNKDTELTGDYLYVLNKFE